MKFSAPARTEPVIQTGVMPSSESEILDGGIHVALKDICEPFDVRLYQLANELSRRTGTKVVPQTIQYYWDGRHTGAFPTDKIWSGALYEFLLEVGVPQDEVDSYFSVVRNKDMNNVLSEIRRLNQRMDALTEVLARIDDRLDKLKDTSE